VLRNKADKVLLNGKEINGNFYYHAITQQEAITRAARKKATAARKKATALWHRTHSRVSDSDADQDESDREPDYMISSSDDEEDEYIEEAKVFFGIEAAEGTLDYSKQLQHAHEALGHIPYNKVRKMLRQKPSKDNPPCAACDIAKSR
jgi:hypothetical protein